MVAFSESLSMLGVFAIVSPYTPIAGFKSSTEINKILGELLDVCAFSCEAIERVKNKSLKLIFKIWLFRISKLMLFKKSNNIKLN